MGDIPNDGAQPAASGMGRSLFGVVNPFFRNKIDLSVFTNDKNLSVRTMSHKVSQTILFRGGQGTLSAVGRGVTVAGRTRGFAVCTNSTQGGLHIFTIRGPGVRFTLIFLSPPCTSRGAITSVGRVVTLRLIGRRAMFIYRVTGRGALPRRVNPCKG